VEIGKELRCGDWTRRASDSFGQSFVPFEVYEGWIRKCHIIQNLNSQVWTELRLFQDSSRYYLARRLRYDESAEVVVR